MLDVFEAMTTEERRTLYAVAVGCLVIGVGAGFWFYSEWAQLKRVASHLVLLAAIALGVWYVVVLDGGGQLANLINPAPNAAATTHQSAAAPAPAPPPTAPPALAPTVAPAPAGAWWE